MVAQDLLSDAKALAKPSVGELPELEKIRTDSKKAQLSFSFFDQILKMLGLAGAKGNAKADTAGDEVLRFKASRSLVSPNEIESALNEGFHADKLARTGSSKGSSISPTNTSIPISRSYNRQWKQRVDRAQRKDSTCGRSEGWCLVPREGC